MSIYELSQEVVKGARPIGGLAVSRLLRKMRTEGAEIAGLGTANLPLLDILPALGVTRITVRDRHMPSPGIAARLHEMGADLVTGEGYLDGMRGVILRTPSLRPDAPGLLAARERGAAVISEMALFLALCPAEIYAVTGSDGKTTTAMMAAAMLEQAGRCVHLGGNIGTPLLAALPEIAREDAVVLELSSFQLSDLEAPPGRSAITNVTENHLDWHTDMGEYLAAKARILGRGTAVLNAGCPWTAPLALGRDALLFSATLPPLGDTPSIFCEGGIVKLSDGGVCPLFPETAVRLPGRYNLENAMAAAGLVLPAVPPEAIEAALGGFCGARHRCEYLGILGGVRCYDSSIDTTPARTAATLSAFREPPVVLLGGRGKRLSLAPLAECVTKRAAGAVLFGEEAEAIAGALCEADPGFRFSLAPDFDTAVRHGHAMAGVGGALLLSPACTSFDLFSDYKERGDRFADVCRCL